MKAMKQRRFILCLMTLSAAGWAYAAEAEEAAPVPERTNPALAARGGPTPSKAANLSTSGKDLCKQNFDQYKTALRKDPNDTRSWAELRVCADLLKRWGEAGAIASAALEKGVKRPEPHLILGHAYFQSKDFSHAIDEFRESVRLKDDQAQAYFYMGLAYLHLNQPSDAVAAGTRAAELDPNNSAYHRQLAFSYFMVKDDAKCEASAKRAIDIDVNDVAAYKILGNLYTRQGRMDMADHMMEEAIHANGRIASANPFVPDKRLSEFEMPKYFQASTPPSDTEMFLKAQWERMKQSALKADAATTLLFYSSVGDTRQLYQQSFERMSPQRMMEVYSKLGEISDCQIDATAASAECRCPVTGAKGTILETKVRFHKDPDAIWRIQSF
jgi:tetratricopeptide (TPR) repeat protein